MRMLNSMRNSKKGIMKTVVAIFALIFLIFIFIIFIFLFRLGAKHKEGEIDARFSSVGTEYVLKAFLRSPVQGAALQNQPKDMLPSIGTAEITNADLVSWTCLDSKTGNNNFNALRDSASAFFDSGYGNDWNLKITYTDPKVDSKKFGHMNYLEKSLTFSLLFSPASPLAINRLLTHYREKGFASQVIPCLNGGLAQISFKSQAEYFKIKSFDDTEFKD